MDLNRDGSLMAGQSTSGTLTMAASGRFTDTHDNVIYLISPTSFLLMNVTPGNSSSVVQLFEQ